MFHSIHTCTVILSQGAPTLIIGNHELKGTSNKLKEPFAVLRKRKASQIANDDDDGNNGADGGTAETNLKKHSGVQLEVVGVVKKKLMFDSYPKSIMRQCIEPYYVTI